LLLLPASTLHGQTAPSLPNIPATSIFDPFATPSSNLSPLTQPNLSPGQLLLMDLEVRFANAVAVGGGKAFATWFADDAVSLSNGHPVLLGRGAVAASAEWDPALYQLTWAPAGARMGPSNDMGFTWGHYEGHSKDAHGEPVVVTGRYITIWKKLPDGTWKVAMDASATEPPLTGDCCVLPKP
jgi:ketosteroid isomerase-like protein